MTYLDNIWRDVVKPGRYVGGEWNSVLKNWDETPCHFLLAYPDLYDIGMSSLTVPLLYDLLNRQPDVLAERVFAPWVDMAAVLRKINQPLVSLESGHSLKDFDIVGFSIGYELSYTNVLEMLALGGVTALAVERGEDDPLVIAGGSAVLNPEPMADFVDLFLLGECEDALPELLSVYNHWRRDGKNGGRRGFLEAALKVGGVYVPSFYEVDYDAAGIPQRVAPVNENAPAVISRNIVDELPPTVTRPLVPNIEVVHDRAVMEIQRGCTRGCRFCNAGMLYRPRRERGRQEIVDACAELLANTGHDEVSLLSLSSSDYSGIRELVRELGEEFPEMTISLPSLRLDSASVALVASLPSRRRTGLTFAPEAGTDRLRRVINKVITDAEIMGAAEAAFARGWKALKLYFMLGLPTETPADIEGVVAIINEIMAAGSRAQGRKPQLRVSVSTFVPKAHTPFQWAAQADDETITSRQEIIRQGLRKKGVRLSWSDAGVSLLEGVLSRGDRRVGQAIYRAWQSGCVMDAWGEQFDIAKWRQAFDDAGLSMDFYARRERPLDEMLPWSHIDIGVSAEYLKQEYRRAMDGEPTGDCRVDECNYCGLEERMAGCREKLAG